eukprot:1157683-Pelagomonas_calceolata.AAC.2
MRPSACKQNVCMDDVTMGPPALMGQAVEPHGVEMMWPSACEHIIQQGQSIFKGHLRLHMRTGSRLGKGKLT